MPRKGSRLFSKPKVSVLTWGVDRATWLRFRELCSVRKVRQNEVMKSLITNWVIEETKNA